MRHHEIVNQVESKSNLDILNDIGYDKVELITKLKTDLLKSSFLTEKEKKRKKKIYIYI